MKYFITTFGCQQNTADSERIASLFENRGMTLAKNYDEANYVIINTCMVRQKAENRTYGLINNLKKIKEKKMKEKEVYKIILTGCIVGIAYRDKTGKFLKRIRTILPEVDEFMPIEEVGFDNLPIRQNTTQAWVPISNGCNNFCTYCVVPYTRGRETSRPYEEIIKECQELKLKGYRIVTLLGQNVNSYGTDIISRRDVPTGRLYKNPVYVKHLGRFRIPTLFPYLLEEVAQIGFEKVDFVSSNPWDFSDELIEVIARNNNITRTIHLPVQSGDNNVLKRMNRWYSHDEYLKLVANLKSKINPSITLRINTEQSRSIKNLKLTTDIIVGFCGETDEEFQNTVRLCEEVGFEKAYISMYSPRPQTAATKNLKDDVLHKVKKRRWQILEDLINKPCLR